MYSTSQSVESLQLQRPPNTTLHSSSKAAKPNTALNQAQPYLQDGVSTDTDQSGGGKLNCIGDSNLNEPTEDLCSLESILEWAERTDRNDLGMDEWIKAAADTAKSDVQECFHNLLQACGRSEKKWRAEMDCIVSSLLQVARWDKYLPIHPLCKDDAEVPLYLEITLVETRSFTHGLGCLPAPSELSRKLILSDRAGYSTAVLGIGYLTPSPAAERFTDWIVALSIDGTVWLLKDDNIHRNDRDFEDEDGYWDRGWTPDHSKYDAVFGCNIIRFHNLNECIDRRFREVPQGCRVSGTWSLR